MADQIRLLLADDHPLIRAGIGAAIADEADLVLLGEATDGHEAQQMSLELQPNVLLLDLNMPGPPASETVRYLKMHSPAIKIIALTAYNDSAYIRSMIAAGVAGYVLKDEATSVILQAVRRVAQGDEWYSQDVMAQVTAWARREQMGIDALSEREQATLRLIVDGKSNHDIAGALRVSEKTVERHVSNILNKLGVSSRVEAAVLSVKERWM